MIAGDLNAHIGNNPIPDVMGPHGEQTVNSNGKLLIDFVSYNSLKIINTFFKHKDIYKFTWSARGLGIVIDYTIANRKFAALAQDTRVYRGEDAGSDHYLLISKIAIPRKWRKYHKRQGPERKAFKVNLSEDESIRYIYNRRLDLILEETPESNNINIE